ncbi:MAG: hypothetical protein ACD_46C00524G0002 [uncultured bacterium]|nr:MAG: hypothetical protein ACD_46C00524G0002 [uncultured bacterium]
MKLQSKVLTILSIIWIMIGLLIVADTEFLKPRRKMNC